MKSLLLVVGLMLAGCGGGADPDTAAQAEDANGVFKPMTEQIDKAKAVEGQIMQQKENIDKALDDADNSTNDAQDKKVPEDHITGDRGA